MRSKYLASCVKFLVFLLIVIPASYSQSLGRTDPVPASINDLTFQGTDVQTAVVLRTDRLIDYRTYYPNPRLFILDIPEAESKLKNNYISMKTPQVDFATLSQIGEGQKSLTRIEFNLNQPIQYDLQMEGSRLRIVLSSLPKTGPETAARPVAQPSALSLASSIRDLTIQESDDQVEFTLLTTSKAAFKLIELDKPQRLVIDVENSSFRVSRKALAVKSDLVQRIRFGYGESQEGKIVRCVFDLAHRVPVDVMSTDSGLIVRFQKPAASAPAQPAVAKVQPPVQSANESSPILEDVIDPPGIPVLALNLHPVIPSTLMELQPLLMPQPLAAPLVVPEPGEPQSLPQLAMNSGPAEMVLFESSLEVAKPALPSKPAPLSPAMKAKENVSNPIDHLVKTLPPDPSITGLPYPTQLLASNQEAPPAPALLAPPQEPQRATQPSHSVAAMPLVEPVSKPVAAAFQEVSPAPPQKPASPVVQVPANQAPTIAPSAAGQVISQPASPVAPRYSGELISLELKDADLKDFFRLIGEISGLNIVLDPDVKGNLTIFLNDVPWDQALDVVLKNNSLGKQLDGNVLRIAANSTLEAEEGQRKRLSDARVVAAELQTETRVLSYAKAVDLSVVLKKVLSPRGDIIVDPRTNSMIISDIPGKFPAIDALIKQLDKKIKQVEIEARVIAATRDFVRDIGIQWGAIMGNNAQNTLAGALPGNPFARTPPPNVTVPPSSGSGGAPNSVPLNVNLGANAATSALYGAVGFTSNFILDVIITAAERTGSAKLLSKPKIITQDNIEGFVQQGVKIPVQTTINNTVSVQFFDFALKLKVTPQITDEGTIMLNVDIENSTPDFSRQVQGVPTVNTQQTKTTVLVTNGGTVVVGGVLIDNEQTNVRQVPGFGSLPVIGYLFKNKAINKQTQELIFFLSPKIL